MSWATGHIKRLTKGIGVSFRPRGNSMQPLIKNRQLCFVNPIYDYKSLKIGDIVLCKVKGRHYLHIIKAIKDNRF